MSVGALCPHVLMQQMPWVCVGSRAVGVWTHSSAAVHGPLSPAVIVRVVAETVFTNAPFPGTHLKHV